MAGDEEKKENPMRENVKFALTAFFLLVAVFSLFTFLFLVPFFIEPALATIYMEFDPVPVTCQTTEASFHRGLSNCNWSSCREGCTREVYECWHIRVRYLSRVPVGQADSRSVRDRIAQYRSAGTDPPRNFKQLQHFGDQDSAADASSRLQSVLPHDDEDDLEGSRALTFHFQSRKTTNNKWRFMPERGGIATFHSTTGGRFILI